jgi:hypothetical protein
MNRRVLERHLRQHECRFLHHGARHDMWINPITRSQSAIPRHRDLKRGTVRVICRQLDVPTPPGL